MVRIKKCRCLFHLFVSFDEVEQEFSNLVNHSVQAILLTEAKNGERKSEDVIFDYLSNDNWEERLKTIVGLSGGSIEKLKRIIDAILPDNALKDIGKSPTVRREIAKFLSHPEYLRASSARIHKKVFLFTCWMGWNITRCTTN